jgi:uncharacterized protein (DUF1330 family)
MAAYVISEVEIRDERSGNEYRTRAAASIEQYGGRYLVRGAAPDVVEGEGTSRRIVIVEFPSMQRLREWYASPAYAEALKFRATALERRLLFVEGVPPS